MPYQKTVNEKRLGLIKALNQKIIKISGAYNPLCAKLIAEIGFDGVYASVELCLTI